MPPTQITVLLGAILTVGSEFTVKVVTAVLEQPVAAAVPVTVYAVVDAGPTEIVEVVAPVFHEYVEAPVAVIVVLFPKQIAGLAALTVSTGSAFTDMLFTAMLLHDVTASVPETEYEVVEAGLTEMLAVVGPVFQVYVPAPLAVSVTDLPTQIKVELAEMATTGRAFTETL